MSGIVSDVQRVAVAAASSGDNTLKAAVTGKKLRVVAFTLVAASAVTARLESGAGGTALTGQMQLGANAPLVLPYNPAGWCETAAGALLNLELGSAVNVDGVLDYVEIG